MDINNFIAIITVLLITSIWGLNSLIWSVMLNNKLNRLFVCMHEKETESPVIANRSPTSEDLYPISTLWLNKIEMEIWILSFGEKEKIAWKLLSARRK